MGYYMVIIGCDWVSPQPFSSLDIRALVWINIAEELNFLILFQLERNTLNHQLANGGYVCTVELGFFLP